MCRGNLSSIWCNYTSNDRFAIRFITLAGDRHGILITMSNELPSAPLLPGERTAVDRPEISPESNVIDDDPDELNEHVMEPGDPDGVISAEERRIELSRQPVHKETAPLVDDANRKKTRWPIIVGVALLVLFVAAGAYWFGVNKTSSPSSSSTQAVKKLSTESQTINKPVTSTKRYDSTIYTLSVDYPSDWTISDTDIRLLLQSPVIQITQSSGSRVSGKVLITVQKQQANVTGFPQKGAVTALSSSKLTYKKPTEVQRAQTYLSFLSYGETNGLDRLFLTGDNGYQSGQSVPMSDIVKGNPLVSVGFAACATNDCTVSDSPTYIPIDATAWQGSAMAKTVVSLLETLQFN